MAKISMDLNVHRQPGIVDCVKIRKHPLDKEAESVFVLCLSIFCHLGEKIREIIEVIKISFSQPCASNDLSCDIKIVFNFKDILKFECDLQGFNLPYFLGFDKSYVENMILSNIEEVLSRKAEELKIPYEEMKGIMDSMTSI